MRTTRKQMTCFRSSLGISGMPLETLHPLCALWLCAESARCSTPTGSSFPLLSQPASSSALQVWTSDAGPIHTSSDHHHDFAHWDLIAPQPFSVIFAALAFGRSHTRHVRNIIKLLMSIETYLSHQSSQWSSMFHNCVPTQASLRLTGGAQG